MVCAAIWASNAIRVGELLGEEYRSQLDMEGLLPLALTRKGGGETGGAGQEETDRHFAWMFANSAGRSIYVCIDPLQALGDISRLVNACLVDGDLLLVDVPCGAGAGALGIVSAIYEQRKALQLPTMPLRITILGGDFSVRARDHFRALVARMGPRLCDQAIEVELHDLHWDATNLISTAAFIDRACELAKSKDRVFLLVNNFSGALADQNLKQSFEHFLSQFGGRMSEIPNSICWIEPNSKSANKMLPKMGGWVWKFLKWFSAPSTGALSNATYQMCDPITSVVYWSGVSVLKADHGGVPW